MSVRRHILSTSLLEMAINLLVSVKSYSPGGHEGSAQRKPQRPARWGRVVGMHMAAPVAFWAAWGECTCAGFFLVCPAYMYPGTDQVLFAKRRVALDLTQRHSLAACAGTSDVPWPFLRILLGLLTPRLFAPVALTGACG